MSGDEKRPVPVDPTWDGAGSEGDEPEDWLRELAAAPARQPVGPGRPLGRYVLGERIGSGGFGTVFAATEAETGRAVAVKILNAADPQRLAGFKREFRLLSEIHHPNLVHFEALGCQDGTWFLAMELLDGDDLDVATARAPDAAIAYLHTVAAALGALRAYGLTHRDLKPSNVRVTASERVVLLDFGLAAPMVDGARVTSMVAGTPLYMAPEQVLGRTAGPPTDWYAFGVLEMRFKRRHIAVERADGAINERPVSEIAGIGHEIAGGEIV